MTPSADTPAPVIDADRFASDLEELNAIGWTGATGLQRTSFSAAHVRARRWFMERAQAAGLSTRVDSAGNHSALLEGTGPAPRTLMLGSHLDSVPSGGRFDGALGVLCALEVVRTVADLGLRLPVTLEAIDFTDEEGTFLGTMGSWAIAGLLTPDMLATPRSGRAVMLSELERMGLSENGLFAARRDPATIAGFLELHIEQGPVLEAAGIQIGVVTGIRGNASFEVVFHGAARHAGTTPMDLRRDAGLGAAQLALAVHEVIRRDFPECVANVGDVAIEPGAFNVVPERATLKLEVRSLDEAELRSLAAVVGDLARAAARRWNLEVAVEPVGWWAPGLTHPRVRDAVASSARRLGLSATEMPSGAGHDAQVMARITPSGMVFVPSRDGISHHPDEFSELEDCINGANVLLGAALALATAL
ncbi:MAG TPA: M20 family metallo-hydrolase [Solirubrobacteraceae bacterium]|nr:M20 family metallo-hydrolase [Solirubrobacteraceae bacterium]